MFRLSDLRNYRQTVIIVVIMTVILMVVSLVFQNKIREVMYGDVKDNFVRQSLIETEAINKSFAGIVDAMKSVALTLGDSKNIGGSSSIKALQSVTDVTGFSTVGVVDIHGVTLHGDMVSRDVFQKISGAFQGNSVVTIASSNSGGSYDVIFAVPVYSGDYIKYVMFIRSSDDELIEYLNRGNNFIKTERTVMTYLLYNLSDVVYVNHSTDGRLLPYFTFNVLSQRYQVTSPAEMKNIIEQNVNEIYNYKVDRYPEHYLSITPTQFDGWSYAMLIPVDVVNNNPRMVMGMFLVVEVATILVLLILLLSYEFTVNQNQKRIYKLAYQDEVTGLFSKARLREVFGKFIAGSFDGKDLFLVKLEMVNRQYITRLYGFEETERIELHSAEIFRRVTDPDVFIARVQDYFVILYRNADIQYVRDYIGEFLKDLETIPGVDFKAYFVAGITNCVFDDEIVSEASEDRLDYDLDNCTIAITQKALNIRCHTITVYDKAMRLEIIRSEQIEHELQPALDRGEFLVYLQPKYDLKNNRLYGAEALIRWNYKFEGIRPPYQFIPIFERNGSIALIDNFVFKKVLECQRRWKELGYRQIPISVNCSQVQFMNANLLTELKRQIQGAEDLVPYIDIEITESATIDDVRHVQEVLREIKKLGFKISMDDFGTGYSSLSNLSLMPFDIIKIDKSFVDRIDVRKKRSQSVLLIKDIISIAHHFNIHTLVEGIETYEQKEILRGLGCEYCQGYYYAKPMPLEDFEKLLAQDECFIDKCETEGQKA